VYLSQITVDLAPPVGELRAFMEEIFPPPLQGRARRMVDSLRPGRVECPARGRDGRDPYRSRRGGLRRKRPVVGISQP